MRDNLRVGFILMIVCIIAAGGLALTYVLTKDQITKQIQAKQDAANKSALSNAQTFKLLSPAEVKNKGLRLDNEQDKIFTAFNGSKIGYAVLVHPRGYGGIMEVAVGISTDGKVKGVSIVSHLETPGLGGRVTENTFLKQFIRLTPSDPVEVRKDVDAISGATISSKALTKGVRTALDYYKKLQ